MVHVEISGPGAAAFIERACPYFASEQPIGQCQYTFFLNDEAGVIDDLIITRLAENRFLIVANAGCREKDIAHIDTTASGFDVTVTIVPRGFLALQGPKAEGILAGLGFPVASLSFMNGMEPNDGWFLSRTGYTGEDGFEIAMPVANTLEFARSLMDDPDVELVGLGARDSLRLEAGLSLYSQDLTETITPHEAGLIWAIPKSLREGGVYIGANALAKKVAAGRTRKRIGLTTSEKIPVRAGANLENETGKIIGMVTSGGFGPSFNGPVALGLIEIDADKSPIFADVRGRKIALTPHKLPFIPHNYKR